MDDAAVGLVADDRAVDLAHRTVAAGVIGDDGFDERAARADRRENTELEAVCEGVMSVLLECNRAGVSDAEDAEDRLGSSLCSGDSNDDGRRDLAMSAPNDPASGIAVAGFVNILDGSTSRLVANNHFVQE